MPSDSRTNVTPDRARNTAQDTMEDNPTSPVTNNRESRKCLFRRNRNTDINVEEEKRRIVPLLARRSYHLPGNSWCDDWAQYMTNNHPLIGMCFHHPYHPIAVHQRVVCLIGSFAFGLAATNIIYLYFYFNEDVDANEPILEIHFNTNHTFVEGGDDIDQFSSFTLTNGMLALWTIGGLSHSIFDLTVWYISVCACCHPGGMCDFIGKCRSVGSYAVIIFVSFIVAVATFLVVLRAAIEASIYNMNRDQNDYDPDEEKPSLMHMSGLKSLSFVFSYLVEMGLALFVYYPIIGTIFFSGILGCGRLPFLGGRPRDVRRQRDEELGGTIEDVDTFDEDDTLEDNVDTRGRNTRR